MVLDTDVGAHARQLGREHEAVLEDVLGNDGAAVSQRRQHHDLCLHIRGEAGKRERLDVDRLDALNAVDAKAVLDALRLDAHLLHLAQNHAQVHGVETRNLDTRLARHEGAGNQERAGLDTVAHHAVLDRMQLVHTLDGDDGRASARDARRPSC